MYVIFPTPFWNAWNIYILSGYLFPHIQEIQNSEYIVRKNVKDNCQKPSKGLKRDILQVTVIRNSNIYVSLI